MISLVMSPQRMLKTLVLGGLLISGVRAQDRSSEGAEASIQDPNQECTPYNYPPVTSALGSFPPIWQPATIVTGDTNAQAKWASISPNVPNIPPKGTLAGDFSKTTYDYGQDPDCWWTGAKCTNPKYPGLPSDVANVPEPRTLGYGFDDGPNCSHNAFYDYLASQNQKATMFYIGSNVMTWPYEAQRGLTDGHEICAHTWSHRYMTAFASADAFAELYYSMQAIKLVVGVTPTCWRPPYGDVDDRIRAIANGLGLRTIIWQYDTFDWEEGTGGVTADNIDQNYQAIINDLNSGAFDAVGAIALTHEIDAFTMQEAMKFHPILQAAFKYLVPVGVALNKTQPYVESNYSLPTFLEYISGQTVAIANVTTSSSATPTPTPTSSSTTTSASSVQPQVSQKLNQNKTSNAISLHIVPSILLLLFMASIGLATLS